MSTSVWATILSSSASVKNSNIFGLDAYTVRTDLEVLRQSQNLPKSALLGNGSVSPMVISKALVKGSGVPSMRVVDLDPLLNVPLEQLPALQHPLVVAHLIGEKKARKGHFKAYFSSSKASDLLRMTDSVRKWYPSVSNPESLSAALLKLAEVSCWTGNYLRPMHNLIQNHKHFDLLMDSLTVDEIYIAESVPNGTTTASILNAILHPELTPEQATFKGTSCPDKYAKKQAYVKEIHTLYKAVKSEFSLHAFESEFSDIVENFLDDFQGFLTGVLYNFVKKLDRREIEHKKIILAGGCQMKVILDLLIRICTPDQIHRAARHIELHATEWVSDLNVPEDYPFKVVRNAFNYTGNDPRLKALPAVIEGCGMGAAFGIANKTLSLDEQAMLLELAVNKPVKCDFTMSKKTQRILSSDFLEDGK